MAEGDLPGFVVKCTCECDKCAGQQFLLQYDDAAGELIADGVRVPLQLLELARQVGKTKDAEMPILALRHEGGHVVLGRWDGAPPDVLQQQRDALKAALEQLQNQAAVVMAAFGARGKAGQA